MPITPEDWEDVTAKTYEEMESLYPTYQDIEDTGLSYQQLMGVIASDFVATTESVNQSIEDSDSLSILSEMATPLLDSVLIVFNESEDAPGFTITLTGLSDYDAFTVIRRDPLGLYSDAIVRGADDIQTPTDTFVVTDYEAPIQVVLHYYIQLTDGSGTFTVGPFFPTPVPWIPVQRGAYGATDYIKSVDNPALSKRVLVTEFKEVSRDANVLGQYHILGRKNPVVQTDVMSGYAGSMVISVITTDASPSSYRVIDALFDSGGTLLFQSHNADSSTFTDFYFKCTGLRRVRTTLVNRCGRLHIDCAHGRDVIVQYVLNFIEQDRPSTIGATVSVCSWQSVLDQFETWQEVLDNRTSWLDVLNRACEGSGS